MDTAHLELELLVFAEVPAEEEATLLCVAVVEPSVLLLPLRVEAPMESMALTVVEAAELVPVSVGLTFDFLPTCVVRK